MNQRQLDLALLGGIGVLLLVILVLALSSAPTLRPGDISNPAVQGADAEPAELETPAAEPAETAQPAPSETSSPAAGEAEGDGAASTATEITVQGDAPRAGATGVERIGFAYATGAAGACGVPLTAWAFVAVSRDLLETYPCGTAVTLTLADETAGRRTVTAEVGDTMSADITNTVNIFVGEDEPALEYGVTRGSLSR